MQDAGVEEGRVKSMEDKIFKNFSRGSEAFLMCQAKTSFTADEVQLLV